MSETIANLAQKNARNAMQRVEALEKIIPNIISATNQSLNQLQQQLAQSVEIMDALIQILGEETVGKVMQENRQFRNQKALEEAKARVAAEVDSGALKPAETVGPNSRIVFQELDANGKALEPGRAEFDVSKMLEPFRTEVQGKKAGDSIKTPAGNTFEIQEVYDNVEKKADVLVGPTSTTEAPTAVN